MFIYKNPNHLIPHTCIYIYHDSIFTMNYIHFYSIHMYSYIAHVKLNILFHLLLILNYILLGIIYFYFIWNTISIIWIIDTITISTIFNKNVSIPRKQGFIRTYTNKYWFSLACFECVENHIL